MSESAAPAVPQTAPASRRAGLVVGAVVALAVMAFVVNFANGLAGERRAFLSDSTEAAARALEQGIEQEIQKLESITGFFRASRSVSPAEFATFTESMEGWRGASSAAVVLEVEAVDMARFEQWFHDAYPAGDLFGISGGSRVPLEPASTHYIVSYLRPAAGVDWLIGYDLTSQPDRRRLIEASLAADAAVTSEFIELVGQDTGDDGFLIAMPLEDWSGDTIGVVVSASDISTMMEAWVPSSLRSALVLEVGEPVTDNGSWFSMTADASVAVPGGSWTITGRNAQSSSLMWRSLARGVIAAVLLGLVSAALTSVLLTRRRLRNQVRWFEGLSEERQKAIDALQAFELMAENSTDVVARQDVDLTYRYVSPSVRATLGYEPEALVGQAPWPGFHPDDVEAVQASIDELVAGADTTGVEFRVRHADGHWMWLHTTSRAIRDADGNLIEIQTASRDVSHRVEQRTALQRAREEAEAARANAEQAAAEKARFLSNVSHEIRTPLSAVSGMAELLAGTDLDAEQREYADSIGVAASTVVSLINDLLDLSRAEVGRIQMESVPFDLRATVSNVVRVLGPQAARKGVGLQESISSDLAERFLGDPQRIGQVLMNLVGNALKFTDRGSVLVTVVAEALPSDEARVKVMVEDTGIGIATGRLEAIFEAFEQADGSTARNFGGTGLGLGISRELVRLMGGSMGVESEEGAGSTFWFELTLPIALAPNDEHRRCLVKGRGKQRSDIVAKLRFEGWHVTELELDASHEDDGMPVVVVCSLDDQLGFVGEAVVVDSSPRRGNAERFRHLGAAGYIGRPVSSIELSGVVERSRLGSFTTRHDSRPVAMPLRVLAADDASSHRLMVERILSRRGHVVESVADGAEALEALGRDQYDVVLLDGQMPGLSGPEVTIEIRRRDAERGRYTPIVAVTGRVSDEEKREALEVGADRWVAKPFDSEQLCRVVEEVAAGHGSGAVLDFNAFRARVGDLADLARELSSSVRDECQELVAGLTPEDVRGDPDTVAALAHRLKGVVSLVGGVAATNLASQLEKAAGAGQIEEAVELAAGLVAAIEDLGEALVAAVDRLEPTPADQPNR